MLIARTAADRHPESATAAARLAQAEQSIGEHERAVAAAGRAGVLLGAEPDTAVAVAVLQVLLSSGGSAQAARLVSRVPDENIRAVFAARIALQAGELEEALAELRNGSGLDALSMRGWIHMQLDQWAEAIAAFRRIVKAGRPTPAVLTNLGYTYGAIGSLQKAVKATLQAQALDNGSSLIALNLVGFYRALGDQDKAFAEIGRLQERRPDHLKARFAEADLRLTVGDARAAYKVLQRARTSALWAAADTIERAELTANLAFVAWRLGERSREEVRDAIIEKLETTEFRSLEIVTMVPALMPKVGDAHALAKLLMALTEANPTETFDYLNMHLATLRCDFEEATTLATERAWREPFDDVGAAQAMYLLADVRGKYEDAIELGECVLRRVPSSIPLRNNLAYALALAGRLDNAKRVLPADAGDSVFLSATRALVDVLGGQVKEGFAGYKRAFDLAQKHPDDSLAPLVHLHWVLAVHRFVQKKGLQDVEIPPLELPPGWESEPRFVLISQLAEREHIPCEALT